MYHQVRPDREPKDRQGRDILGWVPLRRSLDPFSNLSDGVERRILRSSDRARPIGLRDWRYGGLESPRSSHPAVHPPRGTRGLTPPRSVHSKRGCLQTHPECKERNPLPLHPCRRNRDNKATSRGTWGKYVLRVSSPGGQGNMARDLG